MKLQTRSSSSPRRINDGASVAEVSFGTWLRRHRELREVALSEIAAVTKISIRYLEALEEDRFDVLPAPVFAKGFLREYAKYVGLDPDDVVNSYITAQLQAAPEEAEQDSYGSKRPGVRKFPLALLVVAAMLVVGLVTGLLIYGTRDRTKPAEAPLLRESSVVAPRTEIVPEPAASSQYPSPLNVTLDFVENCWVEATVDGRRRISELRVHGDSLQLAAQTRVLLTLGNPQGVEIEVNGIAYDPVFATGRVARNLEIDLDLLRELEGPR
ncbi:MAG: RodZ domain-containing protein [Thermoanaerobaculia bacterium]